MRSKVLAPLKKGKMGYFIESTLNQNGFFMYFMFFSFFLSDGYNPFAIFLVEDPVSLGNMLHYRRKMACESWFVCSTLKEISAFNWCLLSDSSIFTHTNTHSPFTPVPCLNI